MSKRLLAHKVVFNGVEHRLSLVEIEQNPDSGLWSVSVSPFAGETHSTAFVDGTIVVEADTGLSEREPSVKIL